MNGYLSQTGLAVKIILALKALMNNPVCHKLCGNSQNVAITHTHMYVYVHAIL